MTKKRLLHILLALFIIIFTGVVILPNDAKAMHAAGKEDWHGQAEGEEDKEKPKCPYKDPDCCPKEGSPIYLYSGEHFYTHVDMELPGLIPIKIRRHYSSFSLYNAEFGYGWIMNYDYKLYRQHDGNMLLRRGCYDRDVFTNNGDTYTGPDDTFETITDNQDGTYTLHTSEKENYHFDLNGCLSAIEDQNGNQLVFTYSTTKLPINGISPFSNIQTPIVIGYTYQLQKIEQYTGGAATGRYIEFTYNDDGRITRAADSFGKEVFYLYDENGTGDLTAYIDAEGNSYEYTYQDHLLTELSDAGCNECGVYITEYDSNGRVTRQTHGNNILEFNYITLYEITEVVHKVYNDLTGAFLREYKKTYHFDEHNNLIQETTQNDSETITWQYTYNDQRLRTQKTDPIGNVTDYTYDDKGNRLTEILTMTDSTMLTITCTYDAKSNKLFQELSASWDAQTYRTEYSYDINSNLTGEIKILDEETNYTTSYTYNQDGTINTKTDPLGNQISFEYNAYSRITRIYDPGNPSHQTLFTYDNWGNQTSVTDANNNTTTVTYDNLNRPVTVTNPLGEQTIYTYIGRNLVQVEEGRAGVASGHIIRIEYDDMNRKSAVIRETAGGDITVASYTYDSEGNILTLTNGLGNTTTYLYDTIGRPQSVFDPLGNTVSYTYDYLNNITGKTDAENNTTNYTYNGISQLTGETRADGSFITYTYNGIDKLTALTDGNNHTTTFIIDRLGRVKSQIGPDGNASQFTYDGNNNLIQKIDANGAAILYAYNAYNRLTSVTYPNNTVTFAYDNAGNILSYNDGTTQASYTYDALNRIASVQTSYPFGNKTVSYTYDRFGERATATYSDTGEIDYAYDALNRLTTIEKLGLSIVTYAYDNASRLTAKILGNGTAISYTYDNANRLLNLVPDVGGPVSYTYDNTGNRLSRTDQDGTHSYMYDTIYQLTSADHPEGITDENYSYDNVGNRLSSSAYDDWSYNAVNQLDSYNNALVTFSYDNNGNMLVLHSPGEGGTEKTTTYTWNYENRLTSAETPGITASYYYNPFGIRLSKTVNETTIWYLYDREDIIGEYDNNGVLLRSYIHGQGIDEPVKLIDESSGEEYYYISDALGSITQIQDNSQNVVEYYKYDSFGIPVIYDNEEIELQESALSNPYLFTGREWDSEIGLYYYRARYYDADLGRFISKDPIGFEGDGPNLYAYVKNNPIRYVDPYGLWGLTWPGTRYCGPGSWKGKPKNCYDRACKKHDDCYVECGVSAYNRWNFRNIKKPCPLVCDIIFILEWRDCKDEEKCKDKSN
ncbi:RHS repeat-associated core domain-containing protein [Chlamydiota bacterium]